MCLGKPIRAAHDKTQVVFYSFNPMKPNHERPLLNRVLWKFLAEHAHKELRIVFSGEYVEEDFDEIPALDVEAEEYVEVWPPEHG